MRLQYRGCDGDRFRRLANGSSDFSERMEVVVGFWCLVEELEIPRFHLIGSPAQDYFMITDARVLQPEFVPRDVQHRDAEINQISAALQPVTDGDPGETTLIYGPAGAGKTCIAKYTLEKLREELLDINTQYVNCWETHSNYRTLYQILDGIDQTLDIHRQSTPQDEILDRIKNYDGPQYVVILDEADQLDSPDLLYDLYQTKHITMVLITNRETEFFSQLGDRLTSRLQTTTRVSFDPYSIDELSAILADRVQLGLDPCVISNSQLEEIADAAAGDARLAISMLRAGARQATQQELDQFSDAIVEAAIREGRVALKEQTLEKLTTDQEVVYDIIREAGEIEPAELYRKYNARVTDPKSNRTVRTYLQKLSHYNLITPVGNNRGRKYRAK